MRGVPVLRGGVVLTAAHHHLVVQNHILGLWFVFGFGGLFLVFGLLLCVVQKTRLTSSLHFLK